MSDYFVSPSGHDSNPGSYTSPKRTIAAGIGLLGPEDRLLIRGGIYDEQINSQVTTIPNGSSSQRTIISAYADEPVWVTKGVGLVDRQYVLFDRINIDHSLAGVAPSNDTSGYFVAGGHHITIQNAEIRYTRWSGVATSDYTEWGHDYEFLNLNIHHIGQAGAAGPPHGIYLSGGNQLSGVNQPVNILIDGCVIHHCTAASNTWGIVAYTGSLNTLRGITIRKTRVYLCNAGIEIASGADQALIYNCIVYSILNLACFDSSTPNNKLYNCVAYGGADVGFYIGPGGTGTEVKNDIAYGNAATAIFNDGASGVVQSNNQTTNPSFVDSSNGDFHLEGISTAIDAGYDLSAVFTDDFDGLLRPFGAAWDIGAYEYGATEVVAPPPPPPPAEPPPSDPPVQPPTPPTSGGTGGSTGGIPSSGGTPSVANANRVLGFSAGFLANFFGVETQSYGLVLRDSSTGRMITLAQKMTGSGLVLEVTKWEDPSTPVSTEISQLILAPFKFMRIEAGIPELQPTLRQWNWWERNATVSFFIGNVDLHDDVLDGNLIVVFARSRANLGGDSPPDFPGQGLTPVFDSATDAENVFYKVASASDGLVLKCDPMASANKGLYAFEFNGTLEDFDAIETPGILSVTLSLAADYTVFIGRLRETSGQAFWVDDWPGTGAPDGFTKHDATSFMEFAMKTVSGPGTVSVDVTGFGGRWVLLAIAPRNVDQTGFYANGGSSYFQADADDRRNYIISASSELSGFTPAEDAFDNDFFTFWKSASLPASITADFLAPKQFNAVQWMTREAADTAKPTAVEVYKSDDGSTWTLIESFSGLPTPAYGLVRVVLSATHEARYGRLNFTASLASNVGMSEIYFGLIR